MRTVLSATFAIAATALSASAHDHDEHRQLDAHVHGHGTLNIAIEGKDVALELQVPGMDIVGFEHAAKTDKQKAAVGSAKAELAKVLELFKLPDAAGCKVTQANVKLDGEHGSDHHEHDGHGHDDHSHDKHEHAKHDHDHAKHDNDHDSHAHSQFQADYALSCENPEQLATITFDFFSRFAGAQAFTVNIVTAKGQTKHEVTRAKPALDLAGVM